MTSLEDNTGVPAVSDLFCRRRGVCSGTDRSAGKVFRFGNIRSDPCCQRKKFGHHGIQSIVLHQFRSAGGDHDRIDNQRQACLFQTFRHLPDDLRRKKHTGLDSPDINHIQHRPDLLCHGIGRQGIHP